MIFWVLGWVIYGLVVGLIAKAIHEGPDPTGFLATVGIGIAGSFIGGVIVSVLQLGGPFEPAGFVMSIVGGVIFCWGYRKWRSR